MDKEIEPNDNIVYMFGEDVGHQLELDLEDDVVVERTEYEDLLQDAHWLRCLEAAGVNSWEGYDEALRLFDEENAVVEQDVGG